MGWEESGVNWGARAWDWALYQEPMMLMTYNRLLDELDLSAGLKLLDVACGSGLALQIASGYQVAPYGLDASQALLNIAQERTPQARLSIGDLSALPYEDNFFDVITGFNAIQYSGEECLDEIYRVLKPGGKVGVALWKNQEDYAPNFAALSQFAPPKSPTAAAPLRYGDDGVVHGLFSKHGFHVLTEGLVANISHYRNIDIAYTGVMASGVAQVAIRHSGEELMRDAMIASLAPFADPETGRVRMNSQFQYVIATKP